MRAVNLPEFRDTAQIKAEHSVVIELFFFLDTEITSGCIIMTFFTFLFFHQGCVTDSSWRVTIV